MTLVKHGTWHAEKIHYGATQGIAGVFGQGKPAPTLVTFTFLSKAS
jgi:hypothetical protein